MSGAIKKCTSIAGLTVNKAPHHTLTILYGKILRTLKKMPETAAYRKYTEQIIQERAKILKQTSNYKEIEDKIGCGQVEEIIVQAEKELLLARKMLIWKPWEPLCQPPPPNQWEWPPVQPIKPS